MRVNCLYMMIYNIFCFYYYIFFVSSYIFSSSSSCVRSHEILLKLSAVFLFIFYFLCLACSCSIFYCLPLQFFYYQNITVVLRIMRAVKCQNLVAAGSDVYGWMCELDELFAEIHYGRKWFISFTYVISRWYTKYKKITKNKKCTRQNLCVCEKKTEKNADIFYSVLLRSKEQ